jgi:hypothetical protein
MIRSALALALALGANGALACTWMPNAADEYVRVRDAEARYAIVRGTFTPEPGAPIPTEPADTLKGHLRGTALGLEGFDLPYDETILWRPHCYGGYCEPPPPPTIEIIAFLELAETGPVLETGICGGGYVIASEWQLEALESCHSGGACPTQY